MGNSRQLFFAAILILALCGAGIAQTRPATIGWTEYPPLPRGTKTMRDIEYTKGGGNAQSLDLFVPPSADQPLPLVIWVHGGGWSKGDKHPNPALVLVAHGYAVASVNYRLSDKAQWPAQINDCKAAVRWLRAHAKENSIDPDRFGAWGGSAGGHLVALLGTAGDAKELEGDGGNENVSSKVQAVCDYFGPSDFTRIKGRSADNAVTKLLGGPVENNEAKAKQASPLTYVSDDDPPFLIMHGDRDPVVNPQQSQILFDALKQHGVEVTLEMVPGAGHGGPQFSTPEHLKMIVEFFDKHLKNAGK